MKITRITAKNWIGARDVDISLQTPALLIGAQNWQGKSSIREAINAALSGDVSRVDLKGEYKLLVNDQSGDAIGMASVITDLGSASFTIPSGAWAIQPDSLRDDKNIRMCLDPEAFMRLDDTEKRRYLAHLSKVPLSVAEIESRLIKRGLSEEMAKAGAVSVKNRGWDGAQAFAADTAKELKGSWQTTTGKPRWGEKIGAEWKANIPEFDQEQFDQLLVDMEDAKARIAEANENIGSIKARIKTIQTSSANAAKRREQIADIPRLQQVADAADRAVTTAEAAQAAAVAKVTKASDAIASSAPSKAAPAKANPQPKGLDRLNMDAAERILNSMMEVVDNSDGVVGYRNTVAPWGEFVCVAQARKWLKQYVETYGKEAPREEQKTDPALIAAHTEAAEAAKAANETLRLAQEASRVADAALNAAIAVRDSEGGEEAGQSVEDVMEELREAQGLLQRLEDSLKGLEAQHSETKGGAAAVAKAKKQGEDAARLHGEIMAWLQCSEALSPDGIQAELVTDSLAPFNDTLRSISDLSGWPIAEIKPDMNVISGGRLYGLLSEAERWLVDASIAMTIAKLSGLKLIVLDRIDVLSPANRSKLVGLVDEMIYQGMLDGAVLLATLREPPKIDGLPETFSSAWIEKGRVISLEVAPAQATE